MVHQHQLRVWRARLDLSQQDLARVIETNQSRISRAEKGMVRLSDAEMAKIQDFITHTRTTKPRKKGLV